MNGYTYIKQRQIQWARRKQIPLVGSQGARGEQAYTERLEQNLFEGLQPATRLEFQAADGGELGNGGNPAKMQAVHSSSALACNLFQYLRRANRSSAIAVACGVPCNENATLAMEAKLPIMAEPDRGVFPQDPNIDGVIVSPELEAALHGIGIEVKLTEPYCKRGDSGLKDAYVMRNELWQGLANCHELGQTISVHNGRFKHLDAAQLLKHVLGLKHRFERDFTLVYLSYDVPGEQGCRHGAEIEEFSSILRADGVNFVAVSVQQWILNVQAECGGDDRAYVDYICERYL